MGRGTPHFCCLLGTTVKRIGAAYQVLTPTIMYAGAGEARNQPGCDKIRDTDYIHTLDVYLPTGGERGRFMFSMWRLATGPSAPENWTDWVDEVLPQSLKRWISFCINPKDSVMFTPPNNILLLPLISSRSRHQADPT